MRIDPSDWLAHLDDARTLALAGDAEGVHQVRVALRRLRVWLGFKGHRALETELRWACGQLALLRDLDVFGEVLVAEAREELRVEATTSADEALNSERWTDLREALESLPHPKRSTAKKSLRQLERRMEKLGSALQDRDGEALHRLRRTLRRVRYAREWLGLDTSELAEKQETLGAMCDLLALRAFAVHHGDEAPPQLVDGIALGFELIASEA